MGEGIKMKLLGGYVGEGINETVLVLIIFISLNFFEYEIYCSNRGLKEMPKDIPLFATELRLENNKLSHLRAGNDLKLLLNLRKLLVLK